MTGDGRQRGTGRGRRQRGFTLVELMVALTFSSIIIGMALRVQGPAQRFITDLRTQAYATAELRLAAEWLCHDLAAGRVVSQRGPFFHIEREANVARQYGAWAGTWDLGVAYRLDGDNLLRIDWKTAEAHAVATGLSAFEIEEDAGTWTLHLAIGEGFAGRTLDLVWEE